MHHRLSVAGVVSSALVLALALGLSACGGIGGKKCGADTCQGCCSESGECLDGTAPTACGSSGAACEDCGAGRTCGANRFCFGTPTPDSGTGGGTGGGGGTAVGDACSGAIPITLANGIGAATGDLTGSADDATGSCGGAGHGDVVFTLTTATAGTLTVNVQPKDDTQRVVAFVRSACDTQASELAGACVQAATGGAATLLTLRNLAAGTYFLWVDGAAAGVVGKVDVSVSLVADAGDTCTGPITLPFRNGEANASGTTTGAANDNNSACGGSGPDVVYTFAVTATSNFDVTLTPRSQQVMPVVSLRSVSCAGTALSCNAAYDVGKAASLRIGSLPVGTYFLWVDSVTATAGDYDLVAHLSPPVVGDACTAPRGLVFSNGTLGGTASDTGDSTTAFNDGQTSCGGTSAPDLVYAFTTTAALNLRASVSTTSGAVQPVLALRNGTCTGSERACAAAASDGGTATIAVTNLNAGTWYLWVDGVGSAGGPYALNATLEAPAVGESCANPKPLVFAFPDGGVAGDTGDTSVAFPDVQGTCGGSQSSDVIYSFTTSSTYSLRVDVASLSSGFQPAVYLRTSSCTGTERACAVAVSAGGTATLTAGNLAPGTYYLVVDGASGTEGGYTLAASLTPPPQGDLCTNPKTLTFSDGADGGTVSVSGDTTGLSADTSGTCWFGSEPDEVYSFTIARPLDLRAAVTPSGSYRPVMYLRTAGCGGAEYSCNAAAVGGGAASLAVGGLPAGTYSLYVDGAGTLSAGSGAYTLNASLQPPLVGESCGSPKTLVFSQGTDGGVASDTGDTSQNFADSTSSCSLNATPDAVYTFTTGRTLDFAATATTTTAGYRPVLALRDATCTGLERACAAAPVTDAGTAALSVNGLPAGTYFLWVDGALATVGGPYALSASLSTAPAEEVRALPITPVTHPGPMTVTFQVVDRYGNVMTGDNTTSFTITVSGTAVFTGATTGSIVSGSGTATVVVKVTGGQVTLTLTDAAAQTVTFTATDSQGNGLRYPGTLYNVTAPAQVTPCDTTTAALFTFTTGATPTGAGTVTVNSRGDLNGTGSTEYLDVFMESTAGTSYGSIFTAGPGQCNTTYATATVNVPLTSLQSYLADGTLTVALRPTSGVNCICTTGNNDTTVSLSFPMTITGIFN